MSCCPTPTHTLFHTRPTAVKYPCMTESSPVSGISSASSMSGRTVRASPSHRNPAGSAAKSSASPAVSPNTSPYVMHTPSARAAPSGLSRPSSSDTSRVVV